MINIFRKTRQKLFLEGDSVRYIKYAIGEIVFVVVGILFALQINNWNEELKLKNNTEHLLKQVNNELAFNIRKANGLIDSYRDKDSLVYQILHKEVTFADYKSNPRLTRVILTQEAAEISNEAFLNLINNHENFRKNKTRLF